MPRRLLNQRPAALVVIVAADHFRLSISCKPKHFGS